MYRCPNCHTLIDRKTLICRRGHQFQLSGGVLRLLEDAFAEQLETYLVEFTALREREGRRMLDESIYPQLPCAPGLADALEWRLRCYDSEIVDALLANRAPKRILDVGAWNGWLSNHLAASGHQVTAADYFRDIYDGLEAKRFYEHEWEAVQMDLRDLSVLAEPFDVVVVNRCLQFFDDPPAYLAEARTVLRAGGLLILIGLGFYRSVERKAAEVAAFRRHLQDHGLDEFKPMKGYLDWEDRERIQEAGVELKLYPQLWRANLKARVRRSAPWYAYGLLTVD